MKNERLLPHEQAEKNGTGIPGIEQFIDDNGRLGIKLLDYYEGDILSAFMALECQCCGEFEDREDFARQHFHQHHPADYEKPYTEINYTQYEIALFADGYFGFFIEGMYVVFSTY